MARQWLAQVAQGVDPAEASDRDVVTVADLSERYMTQHARVKKKARSIRSDEQSWRLRILPRLGTYVVADVTRADIVQLHYALRDTPFAANRALQLLSKMFNLAEQWELIPYGTNPVRHIEKYKEEGRERYLSPGEVQRLHEVLDEAERTPREPLSQVHAIRLLIYTGARLSEILTLKWDFLDLENGLAHLPDSKTGARPLYLPEPAVALIPGIQPKRGNPYVLVGKSARGTIGDLYKPWYRLRKQAGLHDVRLHDLRHSFASFGVGMGMSLPMIGKLLGHQTMNTTQRYAHLAHDPMREAAEQIGAMVRNDPKER